MLVEAERYEQLERRAGRGVHVKRKVRQQGDWNDEEKLCGRAPLKAESSSGVQDK